jgi:hypothetical protein
MESSVAGVYFEHLAAYALAVCKECRHGVLPSQVKSHLQRTHRVKSKQAELAADEVRSWAGLIQYASELEVPSQITQAICNRLEPRQCGVPRWNPRSFVGILVVAGSFSNIALPDIYKLNTSIG